MCVCVLRFPFSPFFSSSWKKRVKDMRVKEKNEQKVLEDFFSNAASIFSYLEKGSVLWSSDGLKAIRSFVLIFLECLGFFYIFFNLFSQPK